MRYNLPAYPLQAQDYTGAPSEPDQFPDYGAWAVQGSARNPLCSFGENSFTTPRGGFYIWVDPNYNLPTVGAAVAHVQFTSIEPFFMTPFSQVRARTDLFTCR